MVHATVETNRDPKSSARAVPTTASTMSAITIRMPITPAGVPARVVRRAP